MAQAEKAARFAPSAGPFSFVPSGELRGKLAEDPEVDADKLDEITIYHRFVGHGNRDWRTELEEYDLTLGVAGRFANEVGYDAFIRYYQHDARETGGAFVSRARIRNAIENGYGYYDVENPLSAE